MHLKAQGIHDAQHLIQANGRFSVFQFREEPNAYIGQAGGFGQGQTIGFPLVPDGLAEVRRRLDIYGCSHGMFPSVFPNGNIIGYFRRIVNKISQAGKLSADGKSFAEIIPIGKVCWASR